MPTRNDIPYSDPVLDDDRIHLGRTYLDYFLSLLGKAAGTATLSAGTFTVLTPLVQAGSIILVSRASTGTGVLRVLASGIISGTSFTVTSSDGADAGAFNWLLLN